MSEDSGRFLGLVGLKYSNLGNRCAGWRHVRYRNRTLTEASATLADAHLAHHSDLKIR